MAKQNQELARREERAVAVPQPQESWGREEMVGRDNVAIPFLSILQPLSPQVNPADPKYIEGAKPGQILHTTDLVTCAAVQVIPVRYSRTFLEWVPRSEGGGFRGEHSGFDVIENFNRLLDRTTGRAKLDNGNDLVDTRNMYVLQVHPDGITERALISMSSTQIKKATHWNASLLKQQNIAQFVYDLSAVQEENKKGKWFGWRIKRLAPTPPEMVLEAREFYEQITGGLVTVDRTVMDNGPTEDDDNSM